MMRRSPCFAASSSARIRYILCNSRETGYSELSMQTANLGCSLCDLIRLVQVALSPDFLSTYAVALIPVQLSPANIPVAEAYHCGSFKLAPISWTGLLPQTIQVPY